MATHAEIGAAYNEPETGALFVRFTGACVKAAGAILTENVNTPNHANRLIWANGILSRDQSSVYTRVRAVKNHALGTNAAVQFSPTNVVDSDIDTAVQNALAVLANGN